MDELREYFKKANPEELASLKGSSITHLMSQKDDQVLSALDFMKAVRSIRAHSADARKLAYSRGLNQADREAAMARYDYLDNVADKMSDILEQGIGKEDAARLKEASTAWRERVVPLYKNRIYQNIHYDQKMPSNIINSLRGNNKGNLIIKEAIKNNPETLKNVVGQRFAHKPHELQNAGELAQEYMGQMPELQQMVEQHQGAQRAAERSKQAFDQAEKAHAEITKREADAHRLVEKQQEEMAKHVEKKKKLQAEIDRLDKHIPLLKKAAERKNVSLQEHVKAQKEYDEAKSAKKKATHSLLKYAASAGSLAIGGLGYKAIKGAGQGLGDES
jgi:chromosome segregation ATPase